MLYLLPWGAGGAMKKVIMAVYERGALYPLAPLALREHQRVRIQVMPEDQVQNDEDEGSQAVEILIAAGLVQPKLQGPVPPDPLSWEERQALADRLGSALGKPASEMVIEDRGECCATGDGQTCPRAVDISKEIAVDVRPQYNTGLPRFVGLGSRLGQFSARYTRLAWLYYCE